MRRFSRILTHGFAGNSLAGGALAVFVQIPQKFFVFIHLHFQFTSYELLFVCLSAQARQECPSAAWRGSQTAPCSRNQVSGETLSSIRRGPAAPDEICRMRAYARPEASTRLDRSSLALGKRRSCQGSFTRSRWRLRRSRLRRILGAVASPSSSSEQPQRIQHRD